MTFYADDMVELRHGDCLDSTDGLASLADHSIDVCIADPPYSDHVHAKQRSGMTAHGGKIFTARNLGFDHLSDDVRVGVARELGRLVRRWVLVFSDIESCHLWRADLEAAGLEYVRTGIWHKNNGAPQFTGDRPAVACEAITICHPPGRKRWNGKGTQAFWEHNIAMDRRHDGSEQRVHTTQKPLPLMRELVRLFSEPGELILDPFAGAATTLRAAKDLDRKAIGWELQEQYCELAARRLGQGVLWQTPKQESLA